MPDSPAARQVAAFHRLAALTSSEVAAATDAEPAVVGVPQPWQAPALDVTFPPVDPTDDGVSLTAALARRRTFRDPPADPLTADRLGWLLGHAARADADGRRPHPSAGARYPLRVDVVAQRCDGLVAGVHRYDPDSHGLRTIATTVTTEAVGAAFGRAWTEQARAVLVLSADLGEACAEHDVRGYRYALMEAGHLAQNLLLLAAAADLPACPLGGFADRALTDLVHGRPGEVTLYAVAV